MDGIESTLARVDERTQIMDKRLDKIEVYLEKVDTKIDAQSLRMDNKITKQERRIDSLEQWRSRKKGEASIISAIVATFTAVVLKLFGAI